MAIIHNQTEVLVLQDRRESANAKNTVRLLPALLERFSVVCGRTAVDFLPAREKVERSEQAWILLYPDQSAKDLSAVLASPVASSLTAPKQELTRVGLILLDGTWKQAYRLLQVNDWLHELPRASLAASKPSQYRLRRGPDKKALSTLEAVAESLEKIEQLDVGALLDAQEKMMQQQFTRMPEQVKKRYQ